MPFMAAGIGVDAALNLWGAHKASDASKKAAGQQQQAAMDSMRLKTAMYNRGQEALSPYNAAGNGAMVKLGDLLKIPFITKNGVTNPADVASGKVSLSAFAPDPLAAPGSPEEANQRLVQAYRDDVGRDPSKDELAMQTRGGTDSAQIGRVIAAMGSTPEAVAHRSGAAPAAGAKVMMRAPNGMTKLVDAAHVDHYKARGAQVVG